jgi:hypothetical protein
VEVCLDPPVTTIGGGHSIRTAAMLSGRPVPLLAAVLMRTHVPLFTIPLAGVVACGAPAVGPEDFALQPGAPPPIVTDATVYTLARVDGGYAAMALATYTNSTGRPVYYRRCRRDSMGPVYGLRRTGPDSTARSVVLAVWACVGGVPTGRILPGETLAAGVSLGSTDSPRAQPPITPDQRVGHFRIEFALCVQHADDSDDCEALPQAARESNGFQLRFAQP